MPKKSSQRKKSKKVGKSKKTHNQKITGKGNLTNQNNINIKLPDQNQKPSGGVPSSSTVVAPFSNPVQQPVDYATIFNSFNSALERRGGVLVPNAPIGIPIDTPVSVPVPVQNSNIPVMNSTNVSRGILNTQGYDLDATIDGYKPGPNSIASSLSGPSQVNNSTYDLVSEYDDNETPIHTNIVSKNPYGNLIPTGNNDDGLLANIYKNSGNELLEPVDETNPAVEQLISNEEEDIANKPKVGASAPLPEITGNEKALYNGIKNGNGLKDLIDNSKRYGNLPVYVQLAERYKITPQKNVISKAGVSKMIPKTKREIVVELQEIIK